MEETLQNNAVNILWQAYEFILSLPIRPRNAKQTSAVEKPDGVVFASLLGKLAGQSNTITGETHERECRNTSEGE